MAGPAPYAPHKLHVLSLLWFSISTVLVICAALRRAAAWAETGPLTGRQGTAGSSSSGVSAPCLSASDAHAPRFRPHTQPGGSLHWLYWPYDLYSQTDYVYVAPAPPCPCLRRRLTCPSYGELYLKAGFPRAQASLNVLESALNVLYLVRARRDDPASVLVGFMAVALTWSSASLAAP